MSRVEWHPYEFRPGRVSKRFKTSQQVLQNRLDQIADAYILARLDSAEPNSENMSVNNCETLVDIHCHLIPGIDDGAKSSEEALAMARIAVDDGISTIIATPHQLGNFAHNSGQSIRQRTAELQALLDAEGVPLKVLPGADVRIEPDMVDRLISGDVLTLGDHGRHVLLELPHEIYFPLERVLENLHANGMIGILSHPERNQGLLKQPELFGPLVERGCLMQVTAGSLMGTFGGQSQSIAEWMIQQSLVHFVATDAHGHKSRRPLLSRALHRVAQLTDQDFAVHLCCRNPAAVADGVDLDDHSPIAPKPPSKQSSWFGWAKSA